MNNRRLNTLFTAIFMLFATSGMGFAQNFETGECAVPVPKGENVTCGYLVVPENRGKKNGKTIRLPIIIMKSDSPDPKPDPVLRTLGGPGGSSLRMISGRRFSPWLKERDMILFEQRGTKHAQPALECPEVAEALVSGVKRGLAAAVAKKNEIRAAAQCRARLIKVGIDLSAYNSAESAADIEDLRRILKLERINLYGISYSARLMLNIMRDYPEGIRSVVLESTLPLEVNYDELGVDGIARVLDLFFEQCAADRDCAAAFPSLKKDFYDLVKNTNSNPIALGVKNQSGEDVRLQLNGYDLITWMADHVFSANGRVISAAPAQIQQLMRGDHSPLADYAASKLDPPFYSLGMRYSVWCREEMPFENRRKIMAQSSMYPELKGYEVQSLPDICRVWNVPPAKSIENLPVKSDIPALILGAQYDAYTPPEWGRAAARNLKNSFFFEVPWVGHGPGFNSPPCVNDMIAKFIDDPATRPAPECIEKIEKYFKFNVKKV